MRWEHRVFTLDFQKKSAHERLPTAPAQNELSLPHSTRGEVFFFFFFKPHWVQNRAEHFK